MAAEIANPNVLVEVLRSQLRSVKLRLSLYIVESTDINGGRGGDILVEENPGRNNGCRAEPCYCGSKFCGKDHFPDLSSGNIKTGGVNGADRRSVAVNWNSSFGRKGKRFARSATYERFCETRTLCQPGVVS
ncbi:hypothetical protein SUGI_0898230 [Cryptomeria japonica]|nr:hypothetical protein SUGI_0898230 [Cryptomeria japonica]